MKTQGIKLIAPSPGQPGVDLFQSPEIIIIIMCYLIIKEFRKVISKWLK